MSIIGLILLGYCLVSCVACVIHMWRYRKERDMVEMYAWTLLLFLVIGVGFILGCKQKG